MTQVARKGGGEGDGEGTKEMMDVGVGRGPEGLLHCRLGAGLWLGCPHLAPGPVFPGTHSAHTARRCSSWSRAGFRCSLGLHSGAGAPCTLDCASGHTRCYRPTTCSTPSTPHPLQEHSTRRMGTRTQTHAQFCAQNATAQPTGHAEKCTPHSAPRQCSVRGARWAESPSRRIMSLRCSPVCKNTHKDTSPGATTAITRT